LIHGVSERISARSTAGEQTYASKIDDDRRAGKQAGVCGTPASFINGVFLGTPQFFINGRLLVGAQPVEKLRSIIDEEVARAEKLRAAGTPPAKLYEALQKDARDPPPHDRIPAPAPTAAGRSARLSRPRSAIT